MARAWRPRTRWLAAVLGAWILAAAGHACASGLPRAKPEDIGLSSARLAKISEMIRADVARKDYPGAVVLVARNGRIGYLRSFGRLDPSRDTPMGDDAIFRIYSMSKAITTVAAMTLVEDGKLSLDDPVAKYLPQLGDMKVATDGGAVAQTRPMTVQDLMRHTSGLAYGFPNRTPLQRLYARADLWNDGLTNAELVDRISRLPLAHQPGTAWEYGHSTDVLGRLVELVSGQSLRDFEKARILDPLGMRDTGFRVADADAQRRVAEPYEADRRFGRGDGAVAFFDPRPPRAAQSGGGGMVSTAPDYARFLLMLLNGGTLNGHRVLGRETVAYMTADHLDAATGPGPYTGYGWSLAFPVRRDAGVSPMPGSVGDYFWFSAGGGSYWVDPKERLVVILLVYKPSRMEELHVRMRQLVYAAIAR